MMATNSHASEAFKQYVQKDPKGRTILIVPEGKYKGWVPRIIYSMHLEDVTLPFLRLMSFPVGGTSIGNLVDMKNFSAVGNYLCLLPKSFGTCKSMETLNLSFNHFQQIPTAVFNLQSLIELDCSDNELEVLSPDIGKLRNLRTLKLGGNFLSEIPSEISQCKKIEYLVLSRKWYPREGGMKELPKAACGLKELRYLDVSWHQIHTIPDEVGNLTKLESLNMKGNFLKYVSSNIVKCTSLSELNLTGALKLNSYIPEELLQLSELRTLNLNNNYFSEISPKIKGLKKLRHFIMRRNALVSLPDTLFDLKHLESIEIGDNYLEELSPSVKKLKKLKTLELRGNKLTKLPDELCDCGSLESLLLAFNELESLPDNIYLLANLKELDVSHNQLTSIPLLLDKLEMLAKTGLIDLSENNIKVPPQEICDQGADTLFIFLREYRISQAKHRRKMILLGAAKAGKTSLRNALILGRSKLTAEHERTWVLERHLWEPEPDLRVQVLDFGGHHIYSAAHHMFLTSEALHVLVFDLSKYKPELYDAMVGNWLDAIMDRSPGAVIVMVGTHVDLCKADEIDEILEDISDKMKNIEDRKIQEIKIHLVRTDDALNSLTNKDTGTKFEDIEIQRLREKRNGIYKMLKTRSQLPKKIHVVSCADELTGVFEFRNMLIEKLKEAGERPLPTPWWRYLQKIAKYPEKVLSFTEALRIFKDLMNEMNQSMISLEGSAVSSLEMVLKYLHATGEIMWYADNPKLQGIVFHHPETLVEMLRAIFKHDFDKVVVYDEIFGKIAGLTEKKFDAMKEDFLSKGIMTLELLHFCLYHFKISAEARDIFVDLMLKFDLCYEIPSSLQTNYTSSRILRFPWFLRTEASNEVFVKWPTRTPRNIVELSFQFVFPSKSPPNFFEKLSSRLQAHVSKREDWSNGVLAFKNKSKILVTREQKDAGTEILVAVRGSDLQELWYLLLKIYHDMKSLLQEWPLVHVEQYLLCSHCILRGDNDPYLYPAELYLETVCPQKLYQLQCCLKSKEVFIPACLVIPLDADFQDDIGQHVIVLKEFLASLEDTVDGSGSGILTDLGLMYVAAKLGFDWTLVVSNLGLKQAEIEQIQMDNPYKVIHMISIALQRWRDRQDGQSDEVLLQQLFSALENCNRRDLVDELRQKYNIQEDNPKED
ncbi:malignant fibrous histiocytoma-amplified sequence 1 homolog [Saccostrea cucullata]|uniref:malignant fibrous histiocytoma-amplified sequence 1 homolog n=1 Tax=Saccostrea cuccullata TaxID=36930 RepID=UPI002ED42BE3